MNKKQFSKFSAEGKVKGIKKNILLLIKANPKALCEISDLTSISLPLASYHVRGNLRSPGLEGMGFVSTKGLTRGSGKVFYNITANGEDLLKKLEDD